MRRCLPMHLSPASVLMARLPLMLWLHLVRHSPDGPPLKYEQILAPPTLTQISSSHSQPSLFYPAPDECAAFMRRISARRCAKSCSISTRLASAIMDRC